MNTQKENSHTDKTKTRRYTFAQKKGEEHSCVKLTEGKYKDVIYHYGRVAFAPESEKQDDGKLPMKFDYTIDKNPNNLILLDNSEFIDYIGDILLEPLINAGYDDSNIFALTIYEGFQVKLQNTFWISIIITFPLILLILGYFVKPALEIRTLSFSLYFIFFTLLFYSGIFSSLSIAHVGIEFLLSFNENEIILRSQNYFQFITRISLLFGVSFQLPLIMLFLLNKGIIKVKSLTNKRAEMFIVILIFSAVITPTGDPISLFIFTLPMYLLIEIMIFSAKIFSSFIFFVKTPFNILSMSFLNMNRVLSAVAKCKTTVITKLSLAS